MTKPPPQHRLKPPPVRRTNLASCVVATIFLLFIIILLLILFFTLLKPTSPSISVNAVNLPSFSISSSNYSSSSSSSLVTFTFSYYVSVKNPNRGTFTHYDSSLQLLYAGTQVGFMYVPAGKIGPGRSQYMAATFAVKRFQVEGVRAGHVDGEDGRVGQEMELESRMRLAGRLRILHLFAHHVEAYSHCRVSISVRDGSVTGVHC